MWVRRCLTCGAFDLSACYKSPEDAGSDGSLGPTVGLPPVRRMGLRPCPRLATPSAHYFGLGADDTRATRPATRGHLTGVVVSLAVGLPKCRDPAPSSSNNWDPGIEPGSRWLTRLAERESRYGWRVNTALPVGVPTPLA